MAAKQWTAESSEHFWDDRTCYLVFQDDRLGEKRENCKRKDDEKRETFLSRYAIPLSEAELSRSTHTANKVSQNLTFWIENSSWPFCNLCFGLERQKLFPRYSKRPPTKHVSKRTCASSRYIVPSFALIPDALKTCLSTIFVR